MAQKKKLKEDDIIPLLDELNGNLSAVANKLGVNRTTLYNYMKESIRLQEAAEQAREKMIDFAESSLYRNVINGDTTATIFFLKTQGRSRGNGYNERMEITGKDGGPITVNDVALTAAIEKLAQWQKEDQ